MEGSLLVGVMGLGVMDRRKAVALSVILLYLACVLAVFTGALLLVKSGRGILDRLGDTDPVLAFWIVAGDLGLATMLLGFWIYLLASDMHERLGREAGSRG